MFSYAILEECIASVFKVEDMVINLHRQKVSRGKLGSDIGLERSPEQTNGSKGLLV
jgi:hypothetical protein